MPRISAAVFSLFSLTVIAGADQVRVATWNISEYTGGRVADIQNVIYGVNPGNGLTMRPDVIIGQEMQSAAAATAFLGALNGAGSSPGDWAVSSDAISGTNGVNDVAFFYRTSKFTVVGAPHNVNPAGTIGTGTNQAPRQAERIDLTINGNSGNDVLALYGNHWKAGSASSDIARRQPTADAIRNDANSLPSNYQFIMGGDTNTQSSNQAPYQTMVGSSANNRGRFFDPINTPGTWNNNNAFRFVHTQDPIASDGGMDDRHDQLLIGGGLIDHTGLDYVGNASLAYSTTTWNDPNHSYRAWGNDGTSFNLGLNVTNNQFVGNSIAQSIVTCATSAGGHLPVFLDLQYNAVPEPAPFLAVGLGLVVVARRRRTR